MKLETKYLLPLAMSLLLIVFASTSTAQSTSPASTPVVRVEPVNIANDPDVLAATRLFSAWMEGQISYRGLPGAVVGVVSDQQLVWSQGYGFADLKGKIPMNAATKFRMASHSKLFNATAVMQLREDGKLRLDDPVSKYLPWFKAKPAGDDDGVITIEQLLTHSSGLPREAGDHWSSDTFPTREELQRLFADRKAAFPPSTRVKYSNLAVSVAGMLVEEVSGLSWADYVGKNIFKPLGMSDSSVDQNVAGLAVGYGRRLPDGSRTVMPFIDARSMGAAAGITSNVEDMAKFVSAQFRKGPRGGAQILSSGSLREMHRVRSMEENWSSGFGLGFAVSRIKDKTYIGHAGVYRGYTTRTYIQLDDKIGVIVLTNAGDSEPTDIAQQLISSVGQAVAKAAAPKPSAVEWDAAWVRFAGLYRGRSSDTQVVVMNKRLVMITPNANNLDNQIKLEPLGGGQFRYMAPTGGGAIGEVVRFAEVPGKPMRMFTGDTWSDRVME